MSFKQQLTVVGVKSFKGSIEGTDFDHTKLLVLVDFPSNGTNFGLNVVEMPYGKHSNAEQYRNVQFPAKFDIELTMTTKGYEVISASVPGATKV